MKHINLEKLANGAFTAQVNRAIEEVTKNIQDPNTEPGATRKITVTIGFKPNQERNFVCNWRPDQDNTGTGPGSCDSIQHGQRYPYRRGGSCGDQEPDPRSDVPGRCSDSTAVRRIHSGS